MRRLLFAEEAWLQLYGSHQRNIPLQTAASTQFWDLWLKLHLAGVLPDLPGPQPPSTEKALRSWYTLSRATPPSVWEGHGCALGWWRCWRTLVFLCLAHEGREDPFPARSACGREACAGLRLPSSQPTRCPIESGLLHFIILWGAAKGHRQGVPLAGELGCTWESSWCFEKYWCLGLDLQNNVVQKYFSPAIFTGGGVGSERASHLSKVTEPRFKCGLAPDPGP